MPGIPELLVILVIVLLVFGAGKLPQIGESLGKSIRNFKKAASGGDEIEVGRKRELERAREGEEDAEIVSPKSDKTK